IRISIVHLARDPVESRSQEPVPTRMELVIAALISPGHADNSISIPMGYGRKMPGFDSLPYAGASVEAHPRTADQIGFNAYLLRTASNPHFACADGKNIESI